MFKSLTAFSPPDDLPTSLAQTMVEPDNSELRAVLKRTLKVVGAGAASPSDQGASSIGDQFCKGHAEEFSGDDDLDGVPSDAEQAAPAVDEGSGEPGGEQR